MTSADYGRTTSMMGAWNPDLNQRDSTHRRYWEQKYQAAQKFMASRSSSHAALIEVAAQHPLVNGLRPNKEFAASLSRGIELFKQYVDEGYEVEIYVPGSRHMHNGVVDSVSLSTAGLTYLRESGLPSDILHGDDLNSLYKGAEGVYSSADECFVAASYFKSRSFGVLACVSSPVQVFRKMLHYIEFGVFPLNYSAPVPVPYHNCVTEIFEEIPYILLVDHSFQGSASIRARELRIARKPQN